MALIYKRQDDLHFGQKRGLLNLNQSQRADDHLSWSQFRDILREKEKQSPKSTPKKYQPSPPVKIKLKGLDQGKSVGKEEQRKDIKPTDKVGIQGKGNSATTGRVEQPNQQRPLQGIGNNNKLLQKPDQSHRHQAKGNNSVHLKQADSQRPHQTKGNKTPTHFKQAIPNKNTSHNAARSNISNDRKTPVPNSTRRGILKKTPEFPNQVGNSRRPVELKPARGGSLSNQTPRSRNRKAHPDQKIVRNLNPRQKSSKSMYHENKPVGGPDRRQPKVDYMSSDSREAKLLGYRSRSRNNQLEYEDRAYSRNNLSDSDDDDDAPNQTHNQTQQPLIDKTNRVTQLRNEAVKERMKVNEMRRQGIIYNSPSKKLSETKPRQPAKKEPGSKNVTFHPDRSSNPVTGRSNTPAAGAAKKPKQNGSQGKGQVQKSERSFPNDDSDEDYFYQNIGERRTFRDKMRDRAPSRDRIGLPPIEPGFRGRSPNHGGWSSRDEFEYGSPRRNRDRDPYQERRDQGRHREKSYRDEYDPRHYRTPPRQYQDEPRRQRHRRTYSPESTFYNDTDYEEDRRRNSQSRRRQRNPKPNYNRYANNAASPRDWEDDADYDSGRGNQDYYKNRRKRRSVKSPWAYNDDDQRVKYEHLKRARQRDPIEPDIAPLGYSPSKYNGNKPANQHHYDKDARNPQHRKPKTKYSGPAKAGIDPAPPSDVSTVTLQSDAQHSNNRKRKPLSKKNAFENQDEKPAPRQYRHMRQLNTKDISSGTDGDADRLPEPAPGRAEASDDNVEPPEGNTGPVRPDTGNDDTEEEEAAPTPAPPPSPDVESDEVQEVKNEHNKGGSDNEGDLDSDHNNPVNYREWPTIRIEKPEGLMCLVRTNPSAHAAFKRSLTLQETLSKKLLSRLPEVPDMDFDAYDELQLAPKRFVWNQTHSKTPPMSEPVYFLFPVNAGLYNEILQQTIMLYTADMKEWHYIQGRLVKVRISGKKSQRRILNSEISSLITYLTIQNHFLSEHDFMEVPFQDDFKSLVFDVKACYLEDEKLIQPDGGTLESSLDPGIRLNVSRRVFDNPSKIKLRVEPLDLNETDLSLIIPPSNALQTHAVSPIIKISCSHPMKRNISVMVPKPGHSLFGSVRLGLRYKLQDIRSVKVNLYTKSKQVSRYQLDNTLKREFANEYEFQVRTTKPWGCCYCFITLEGVQPITDTLDHRLNPEEKEKGFLCSSMFRELTLDMEYDVFKLRALCRLLVNITVADSLLKQHEQNLEIGIFKVLKRWRNENSKEEEATLTKKLVKALRGSGLVKEAQTVRRQYKEYLSDLEGEFMLEIFEEIKSCPSVLINWKGLAQNLGFQPDEIHKIEVERRDLRRRCTSTLKRAFETLRKQKRYPREILLRILQALENSGCPKIALSIERRYLHKFEDGIP